MVMVYAFLFIYRDADTIAGDVITLNPGILRQAIL